MITNLKDFKNSLNENFHGAPDRPEVIQDGERQIANYTGCEVKKKSNDNWAVWPKVGQIVYACDDRHGFTSSKLEQMEVYEITNGVIICNQEGIEMPVYFKMTNAAHRAENDDLIAYFRKEH